MTDEAAVDLYGMVTQLTEGISAYVHTGGGRKDPP